MAIQHERVEKRTAAAVAVLLTSPDAACPTELSVTENISSRGARIITKGRWTPSHALVIKSLEGSLYSDARVIYREPIHENVYAIGLELIAPRGNWQRT